jgi:hypothetical protein
MDNIIELMLAPTNDTDLECPECGSILVDVSGGQVYADETMTYDCACFNCQHEWKEQETLADLHPVEPYIPTVPCID